MAYLLYVMVSLTVISYHSVFTQNTIDPEVSKTCASNNGLCGHEIQQMYQIITHLKDKIIALEVREEDMESKLNALETNLTHSKSEVRDLTNLMELKTNVTIIAEKYLHQQSEIDELMDKNSVLEGNISSLQSDNLVLGQKINNLDCLLEKTAGLSNCADLYKLGHRDDGLYTVDLCGEPYQLNCDMTQNGGGWTVIQRRFDGSVDFYRNWDTYRTGFGNLTGEFWLGNDIISLLTKHNKFVLHIYLEDFGRSNRYAEYKDFQMGDAEEKYELHIGSYSGNSGDALTYHKGMKFSTYDNDNDDLSSTNCAMDRHGAFWFNSCDYAHLNGEYSATSSGAGRDLGLVWEQWRGQTYSLKKTIMKIRPMGF